MLRRQILEHKFGTDSEFGNRVRRIRQMDGRRTGQKAREQIRICNWKQTGLRHSVVNQFGTFLEKFGNSLAGVNGCGRRRHALPIGPPSRCYQAVCEREHALRTTHVGSSSPPRCHCLQLCYFAPSVRLHLTLINMCPRCFAAGTHIVVHAYITQANVRTASRRSAKCRNYPPT